MSRPDFPAEQPAGYPDAGYPPAPPSSNFVPGDGYGRPVDPQAQTVALPADPTTFGAPDHAAGLPVPTPEPAGTPAPASGPAAPRPKHSRTGAAWVALIVAAIVFVFLLIFVVQNPDDVQVKYLWFEGTLSLGVAMLFAAVAGALTAGLLGTVRILQLRSRARKVAAGK